MAFSWEPHDSSEKGTDGHSPAFGEEIESGGGWDVPQSPSKEDTEP